MDAMSIARLATTMADTSNRTEIGYAVLKKAQDVQASSAQALIEAIPPAPAAASLPSHLGQNINTTA
ncbi:MULTISPECIES: YjfB family protein [unclassified Duganella]|uniref:YjfB family protein n=1 Tax=unclassified Duganella TaxID=2636909 RepID=UPI0006FA6B05|nr:MULTISPECIES: YjfB family protein [unclassified Duganella]KQV45388.1 hypothetical protein ASD07_17900 [Duganella sp. Root336D2]KRB93639.1 hypothetical protein ASE26_27725 [Duganella sp. Root198D2]